MFQSTYTCSPNNDECKAATKWEIAKNGISIKTGNSGGSINDTFITAVSGTYTIKLEATCNGKTCQSCIYTVIVNDLPPIDPCHDVLLCNTGFEDIINVPHPTTYIQTDEANIPCWETTATDHLIEIWHSGFNGGYGPVSADSGQYFAELNATQTSTLYQTFTVAGNVAVTISFAHKGRHPGPDTMEVLIVDSGGTPHSFGTYADDYGPWKHYTTVPYNLTSGTYKLQFKFTSSNGGTGNNAAGNFIDSISITCH